MSKIGIYFEDFNNKNILDNSNKTLDEYIQWSRQHLKNIIMDANNNNSDSEYDFIMHPINITMKVKKYL
jgi:hypothetical protein